MMLFDAELMDDRPIVKVSKTQNLINKVADMQDVYSTGNTYKVAAGGLSIASTLGLMLGSLIGSPGLVGFLLFSSVGTALMAYLARVFEESTSLGAAPLFELYQGQDIGKSQLQGREQLHWQAIDALGDEMVEKVEDSGYLELLLDHVKHANLKLRGVDNDDYDRTYYALMQSVKSKFLPCLPPVPSIDRTSPTPRRRSLPTQQENPDIWEDSENQGSIDRYLAPAAVATTFDWSMITRRPHLFVLGDTGSGKTSLVQWLIKTHYPKSSEVLVLDPHGANWGDFPCIGRGRNFDAIELALEKLVKEMDRRYASGSHDHPPQICIVEEIPAIAANTKNAMSSIASLALEARKVKIFLILLSQGWEVNSLGLQGKGSVRDSFCFISLGEFAKKKAKELGLTQQIKGVDRPCFVGDELAIVPELDGYSLASQPDIRSSLDRLYQSATAPEPTPTPKSKIDLLSDEELEDLLEKVLAYAKRKERVKPSDISSGLRSCRGYTAPEIMQLFDYLVESNEGNFRGNEFIPN